jgi:hypothetical protein
MVGGDGRDGGLSVATRLGVSQSVLLDRPATGNMTKGDQTTKFHETRHNSWSQNANPKSLRTMN